MGNEYSKKILMNKNNNNEIKIEGENINKLKSFILNKKNFNEEKTKILSKEQYILFITIINEIDIDIIHYLHRLGVSAIKIIINGFISYEFNDNNLENCIIEIIRKIISNCFNKNIFYFVYGFLSYLFRNPDQLKDINSINKFEKIFNIWKLLYDTKINSINLENEKISSINFFYDVNVKNNNINIEFIKYNDIYRYTIEINFILSPFQELNKFDKKFSFLKLYDDKKSHVKFKYKDIFNKENKSDNIKFSSVYNIKFILARSTATIYINDNQKKIKIIHKEFNFSKIVKLEILNNFNGEVSNITILREVNKENLKCEIYNSNNKVNINISSDGELIDNSSNNLIKYNGKIFDNKLKDNIFIRSNSDLSEIKYFGGFECLIPLFKLINYILNHLKNKITNFEVDKKNLKNKNELYINNDIVNKSIKWIKEIIEIIIKLICLSGSNYKNFINIIVPLIGSLSEISHTLNNLISLKIISNDNVLSLFNDEVFHILYLIILNANLSNNIKIAFKSILGIDLKLFNFSMKTIILDINQNKCLDWYFSFLFNFVEFIMLYFNLEDNNIKLLIEQLNKIINFKKKQKEVDEENFNMILGMEPFVYFLKNYNIKKFYCMFDSLKENKYYIKNAINMIKTYLNAKKELLNNNTDFNELKFLVLTKEFIECHNFICDEEKTHEKDFKININSIKKEFIIDKFKYYYESFDFLKIIMPFINKENFICQNELLMGEIIDYHGQYHHTIKELFIFNRLWSKQNLFFKNTLKEMREISKIKYKNLNYYTANFQRPIIYPFLDYKNRYPDFSLFKIDDDTFYKLPENKDDYNFEFICPDLDGFVEKYNQDILNKIRECEINTYYFQNTCLVKSSYHIKGNFIFINNLNNQIIYFISQNSENKFSCNKSISDDKTNLKKKFMCYGALFRSPKKYNNKIIKINLNEIRLILKRIYFYRNSAIEIFTQTKSYYFNFSSEENLEQFFSHIINLCKKNYFPINIKNKLIGFKKINIKIAEKIDLSKLSQKPNNFIEFISDNSNQRELCEMCVFDIIILINLISNRSYLDLNQYPVFPLLNFYDIKKDSAIIERDFNKHIGFQDQIEQSKRRVSLFRQSFDSKKEEIEEEDDEQENTEDAYFFNTHFSNIVYVCNYLIRLFPFSFCAIELQGEGFDSPNRLFSSIENTFFNIMTQKSDIRELIPEFFYFPEMFMNINYINFHYKTNKELVDNVVMPKNLSKNNASLDKNEENQEIYFIFVESIKNNLESLRKNLNNWINIIFGSKQKLNEKNEQYFRTESYMDLDTEEYKKYLNNENLINSIEFGLTPLKTIFSNKTFPNQKIDLYEKLDKEIENEFHHKKRIIGDYLPKFELSENYFNNKYQDYWEETQNINFRIINNKDVSGLRVYKNDTFLYEINDYNDILIDFFYNRRLNMFATSTYDGFICLYIIPNKLITMIKNPYNSYFSKIFLSANPFPSIIAFDKNEKILISYSLSGLFIKKIKLLENISDFQIFPLFNVYGGTFKDRIFIFSQKGHFSILNVPFFNNEKEIYKKATN